MKVDPLIVTEVWKNIKAIASTSVFKPYTCIEHDGEFICKGDEISDILTARYAEVRCTETYIHNFLARKDEVKDNIDFKCEG